MVCVWESHWGRGQSVAGVRSFPSTYCGHSSPQRDKTRSGCLKSQIVENPVCSIIYIGDVLVRVSIAVMKHHGQKASWEGKGLFGLHFCIAVHHQRKAGQELKQNRNLEAGTEAEAMEGSCLFPMACSACFLIEPRTTSSRVALPIMGWVLSD